MTGVGDVGAQGLADAHAGSQYQPATSKITLEPQELDEREQLRCWSGYAGTGRYTCYRSSLGQTGILRSYRPILIGVPTVALLVVSITDTLPDA